jgi:hypothetical protein
MPRCLRVAREVFRRQSATLDQGFVALSPMTMAEVAAALDLHQTTVSPRGLGASADTPRGTWWLRALFSPGTAKGQAPRRGNRARLAGLVAAEDPRRAAVGRGPGPGAGAGWRAGRPPHGCEIPRPSGHSAGPCPPQTRKPCRFRA